MEQYLHVVLCFRASLLATVFPSFCASTFFWPPAFILHPLFTITIFHFPLSSLYQSPITWQSCSTCTMHGQASFLALRIVMVREYPLDSRNWRLSDILVLIYGSLACSMQKADVHMHNIYACGTFTPHSAGFLFVATSRPPRSFRLQFVSTSLMVQMSSRSGRGRVKWSSTDAIDRRIFMNSYY